MNTNCKHTIHADRMCDHWTVEHNKKDKTNEEKKETKRKKISTKCETIVVWHSPAVPMHTRTLHDHNNKFIFFWSRMQIDTCARCTTVVVAIRNANRYVFLNFKSFKIKIFPLASIGMACYSQSHMVDNGIWSHKNDKSLFIAATSTATS